MNKAMKNLFADRVEVQETTYKYLKVILILLAVGSILAFVL